MTQLIEGKKHVPFEARIALELKGLFVGGANGEEIKWREGVNKGPFEATFHSPLAQLWFLYYYGGGLSLSKSKKNKATSTGESHNVPARDIFLHKADVVETDGNSGDIIDLIIENQAASRSGFKKDLIDQIKKAKKIMLAGCISLTSAASLINKLQSIGFHGQLDIYDISEVPLAMIEAYKKAGFWKGITINTLQRDLFGLSLGYEKMFNPLRKEESGYDMILADVLLHYVKNEEAEQATRFITALNDRGMILLRDMGNLMNLEIEKKSLTKTGEIYQMEKAQIKFIEWLEKNFGFKVTEEDISQMRKTQFSQPPPHGERMLNLTDWIDYLFGIGAFVIGIKTQLLYKQLTTSSTEVGKRIFPIFAFRRLPLEEQETNNFSFTPLRTAMALSG